MTSFVIEFLAQGITIRMRKRKDWSNRTGSADPIAVLFQASMVKTISPYDGLSTDQGKKTHLCGFRHILRDIPHGRGRQPSVAMPS
jgi:hypothetical protein